MASTQTTVRRRGAGHRRANGASSLHPVSVVASRRLSPQMVRVTFSGPTLADFADDGPDQRCKVFLPRSGRTAPPVPAGPDWYLAWRQLPDLERPIMRTYTVRRSRPAAREVDIDFVLREGTGPGTRWAAQARPGDRVTLLGPRADYFPPVGVDTQLLVGDATALPAIASIVEGLTVDQRARVFLEVDTPADELALISCADVTVTWLHLGGCEPGRSTLLLDAVRAAELPPGRMSAWIAGEAAIVRTVRRHLVCERRLSAADIQFAGYWRVGAPIDPD
jgi:NADPH-dependent ferric siderophore reductase